MLPELPQAHPLGARSGPAVSAQRVGTCVCMCVVQVCEYMCEHACMSMYVCQHVVCKCVCERCLCTPSPCLDFPSLPSGYCPSRHMFEKKGPGHWGHQPRHLEGP